MRGIYFRALILLQILSATTSLAPAADKPPAKEKFPGAVVTKLLEGWGGLAWGASIDEFKKKYPDAKQTEGGRWLSGKEDEIGGVKVTVQYTFNKKDQLHMMTFVPGEKDGKTFRQSLDNAGALKGGKNWQNQGVTFGVAPVGDGTQIAIALHAKYADPAATKKQ